MRGEDIGGILEDPLSQANVKYAPGAEPCGFAVFDASAPQPQDGVDAGVVVAVVLSVLAFAAVVVLLAWRVAYARGAERARFIMRTPFCVVGFVETLRFVRRDARQDTGSLADVALASWW